MLVPIIAPIAAAALLLPAPAAADGAETPERIVSKRIRILSPERYEELRTEWEAYASAHPNDPVGWTELARAARYAGEPCEKYIAYARNAIRVGPDYAGAYAFLGGNLWCTYCGSMPEDPTEAIRFLERALELDPSNGEPHFALWSMKLSRGKREEAANHLKALLEGGNMPEPLVDLGYNMLVGVEPNAILLTNGDNDTYPPLAIQAARGFRKDVAIVNLSLLNLRWYRKELREGALHVPVPLLDEEAKDPQSKPALAGLIRNLAIDGWRRPLYAATTLDFHAHAISNDLSLEGIVFRVLPGEEEECVVNGPVLERNLHDLYRIESASSLGFDWETHSALRRLMSNYTVAYARLAEALFEGGNTEEARAAMRESLELCRFHGSTSLGRGIAGMWQESDPDSPEPDRWIGEFGGPEL